METSEPLPQKELTGGEYHMQAELQRESGDFGNALVSIGLAIAKYEEEKNIPKLAEAYSSRFLTRRHQADLAETDEEKRSFLEMAKQDAKKGVEIAVSGNIAELAIPLYNLGKCQDTLGETAQAIESYKKALEDFREHPEQPQNRPTVVAEMKTRLAVAEFNVDVDGARERFDSAVEDLKAADEKDTYSKNVWLSGAYMHMAEALMNKDNTTARVLLSEAEKIIDSDERLKLRKGQLEKLLAKLGQV